MINVIYSKLLNVAYADLAAAGYPGDIPVSPSFVPSRRSGYKSVIDTALFDGSATLLDRVRKATAFIRLLHTSELSDTISQYVVTYRAAELSDLPTHLSISDIRASIRPSHLAELLNDSRASDGMRNEILAPTTSVSWLAHLIYLYSLVV